MPRAEAAQLEEVLVAGDPDSGPEAADQHGRRCGCGDKLLVAFFALVGAAGLGLSLWPGWDVAHAEECTARRTCTYTEGQAFGHATDPVAASWVNDGREGCCTACTKHVDCAAAIFLDAKATGPMVNCIMYPKATPETVSLDGASLCSLPSDGDGATSVARGSLETLLGASAVLTRFGGFAFAFLLGKLLELVGYGGAGTVNTILSPRKAAAAAARAAAGAAEAEGQQAAGAAAGWDAIAAQKKSSFFPSEPPSTWTDARVALGLSVRQAVWSCGGKMLLWHWTQPLSYLAVFGVYYCSLDDDGYFADVQRICGMFVAVREALYLVSTLLALWLNPAYLLLELDGVLRPAAEGWGEGRCGWWRRVDGAALKQWVFYLLAPHHYVTFCLFRGVLGVGNSCCKFPVAIALIVQHMADLCSAMALVVLLSQPSPPVALAIGYWLTTASMVAFVGGFALDLATEAWTGVGDMVGDNGDAAPSTSPCWLRAVCRVCCGAAGVLVGSMSVAGACVLALAPLQLSGAVHGLAP